LIKRYHAAQRGQAQAVLPVVLLVGRLRLVEHRTVSDMHRELLACLEPLGVKIAQREVLSL
jgi:hypothetical protein